MPDARPRCVRPAAVPEGRPSLESSGCRAVRRRRQLVGVHLHDEQTSGLSARATFSTSGATIRHLAHDGRNRRRRECGGRRSGRRTLTPT
jgi:hypothetical protein